MPDISASPPSSTPTGSSPTIADRVQQRLIVAGLAFDRRMGASRPRARRRKDPSTPAPASALPPDPSRVRERACLRMVFRELGDAHRRYRVRSGQPGTPALRAAANAFKQEHSVLSLVPVAAFLDELGILAW